MKVARRVLPVFLIGCLIFMFAGASFVLGQVGQPTVTRDLPAAVVPGEVFDVTVTFAASADNFNSIGLHDEAPTTPSDWNASVDVTWCDPDANQANVPAANTAEYVWFGPYSSGTAFTVLYQVQVPATATPGTYTFPDGWLEWYEDGSGPFTAPITGENQVQVYVPDVNGDGRVNVLDMIRIGMHWGEAGTPGWIPEDVNQDGVVNVLDMIFIGMHWTG